MPSAIFPSPTAVAKLSTRNSSIGTRGACPGLAANDDCGARGKRAVVQSPRVVVAQAAHDRARLAHDRIGDHARRIVNETPPALADPAPRSMSLSRAIAPTATRDR